MKKNQSQSPDTTVTPLYIPSPTPGNYYKFYLLPGTKLSDIYMDAQQVAEELNMCKRSINNMRKAGKLSYTTLLTKIYYFRQEITAIMHTNQIIGKNSLLRV